MNTLPKKTLDVEDFVKEKAHETYDKKKEQVRKLFKNMLPSDGGYDTKGLIRDANVNGYNILNSIYGEIFPTIHPNCQCMASHFITILAEAYDIDLDLYNNRKKLRKNRISNYSEAMFENMFNNIAPKTSDETITVSGSNLKIRNK